MAVSWCVFVCDTAHGVRFGQCRRAVLVLALPWIWWEGVMGQCWKKFLLAALPLKWDLGSAGEENAYGTACGVRFGQYRERFFYFALPLECDSGSIGEEFCILYCFQPMI